MENVSTSPVLVTGGSGYVGMRLILQLLAAGYTVRTTVRSLSKETAVREALAKAGASDDSATRLTFYAADLNSDDGWDAAVKDCEFIHHVASPFPLAVPKNEDDLIVPARDGALRVLREAKKFAVKRVILTSSFAAIGYGWSPTRNEIFTEKDFSIIDMSQGVAVPPYQKSKLIAEKAAWDFVEKEGGFELTVVNPVGIFGKFTSSLIKTTMCQLEFLAIIVLIWFRSGYWQRPWYECRNRQKNDGWISSWMSTSIIRSG
jgi:dihydroflavonol-4-reductase